MIANPESAEPLRDGTPIAFNPSVVEAKIEDTFLVTDSGLLNLTPDPAWPTTRVDRQERPLVLQR